MKSSTRTTHVDTLRRFAQAHGLSLAQALEALARFRDAGWSHWHHNVHENPYEGLPGKEHLAAAWAIGYDDASRFHRKSA